MSGIEVAGLVFGTIPLLISGLEHYAEGLATIKVMFNYPSEFRTLIRRLGIEKDIFENNMESLLGDCVESDVLTELLQQPDGSSWSIPDVDEALRRKLGRSYKVYLETVQGMDESLSMFKERLRLSEDGKGPFHDPKSFREAFKRFRFGLKRSAYMDLVEGIRRDNGALTRLTEQSRALEPARTSRKRRPNFDKIRTNAADLFRMLQKGLSATCKETHQVSLYMGPVKDDSVQRSNPMTPENQHLSFRIVLHHERAFSPERTPQWTIEEAEVRLLDCVLDEHGQQCPMTQSQNGDSNSKRTGRKTVRFQEPEKVLLPAQSLPHSCNAQQERLNLDEIGDLCSSIEQLLAVDCGVCLGYLSDKPTARRHGLFWPQKPILDRTSIESLSLGAVLTQHSRNQSRKLSVTDSRHLALSLALGMLRLHDTPWLRQRWNHNDIMLFTQNGNILADDPFISTQMSSLGLLSNCGAMEDDRCAARSAVRNETLFALGIILIELCMEQSFEHLAAPEDFSLDGTRHAPSDFLTACRLEDQIYDKAGGRYGGAVRRCIHCDFDQRKTSLADDAFRAAVYDNVVTVLEEDVRQFFHL
ncbi:hypothetical protein LTR37_007680 [Vermiconidia calcicola]|uniref:Uncharacterized protein n=1 Tax=Vermiconidia calcicola TaxID=1690605 RepID=A0ACC3NCV9_9PEZI|nr:hypothetical protein LTR37_007680 [Vermiconidia calcicola]